MYLDELRTKCRLDEYIWWSPYRIDGNVFIHSSLPRKEENKIFFAAQENVKTICKDYDFKIFGNTIVGSFDDYDDLCDIREMLKEKMIVSPVAWTPTKDIYDAISVSYFPYVSDIDFDKKVVFDFSNINKNKNNFIYENVKNSDFKSALENILSKRKQLLNNSHKCGEIILLDNKTDNSISTDYAYQFESYDSESYFGQDNYSKNNVSDFIEEVLKKHNLDSYLIPEIKTVVYPGVENWEKCQKCAADLKMRIPVTTVARVTVNDEIDDVDFINIFSFAEEYDENYNNFGFFKISLY